MSYAVNSELRVAASAALLQRGCVNVIKFNEIKVEAGARWTKIGSAVSAHLESLLRQKLGPSDFFVALDDSTFLVSMPSADVEASQVLCLRVAHELHKNFLGACKLDQLHIARVVGLTDDLVEAADIAGENLVRLAIRAGLNCGEELISPPAPVRGTPPGGPGAVAAFVETFIPLWDAQREAITAYRCPRASGHGHHDAIQDRACSHALSHAARRAFFGAASQGRGQVPRFRRDILRCVVVACWPDGIRLGLPQPLLGAAALLDLRDQRSAFRRAASRLLELVRCAASLLPCGRRQLPARISSYGAYQGVGLQAIGLSLVADGAGSTEMNSEVFKLCAAARRLHVLSFVWDATTDNAVCWAREQGRQLHIGSADRLADGRAHIGQTTDRRRDRGGPDRFAALSVGSNPQASDGLRHLLPLADCSHRLRYPRKILQRPF